MHQRYLGSEGLVVSSLGLGCMGLTGGYTTPQDDKESTQVLLRSLELGINFWDTAEVYGPYSSEALIGRVLKTIHRHDIIIATKFGFHINEKNENIGLNSRPEHIKQSLEGSLKRLGIETIDLYYQHRLDPNIPIEESVGAMSRLVEAGKVRYLGLSEMSAQTIRRAHAVHPISVMQSEYSLWERDVEKRVFPTLKELKIGFVPYSPLGRGFITNGINHYTELSPQDWRRLNFPRASAEHFDHNFLLVQQVRTIATTYGCSPAQIALAWLLRQHDNIVPIPGTKHLNYLEDNSAAAGLSLPEQAWIELDDLLSQFETSGPRYSEQGMKLLDL